MIFEKKQNIKKLKIILFFRYYYSNLIIIITKNI